MSLILEALKKAERQHRLGEVPGLGSTSMTEAHAPARGRMGFWIVVLALGMLLLGVYLGSPQPPQGTVLEPKVPNLTSSSQPLQPSRLISPDRAEIEALSEPEPEVMALPPSPRRQPVQVPVAESPSEAQVETAPVAIEADPDPKNLVPPSPKQMSELPDGFVSNMPKLNIDIHSFDERPGRSYVLINMEKYREGDYLTEGPLLSKILQDGVILEYMGERFILPIGSY
ncbi:MAG: general secretion pathway protein GspB [Chromatiales bacterium]